MLSITEYQLRAKQTAVYPKLDGVTYCLLGLAGEVGELANKYKKVIRGDCTEDAMFQALRDELGDCLWYLAMVADELGMNLAEVAELNLAKLADRNSRHKIRGNGDRR